MNDPVLRHGVRTLLAVVACVAALASAFGLSVGLRRAEARSSHQQPTPETWLEASPPIVPAQLARGRRLFLGSCAHCHGADASGDEGPDLHGVEVSDRYIANTITRGIRGEMPSFAKKLGRPDVADLTAYLRSLR